ncbi:hypothetical protein B296_00029642 [Ensete ventricosum]|uniref:Uncharacterized protein n=1 Tax=Ensete ventricosum TaxID=4639 RepID=A0A427AKU2_ENSVE|nr:hypothetical protein B296_00029642 [Ensete ventricosum]
MPRHPDDLPWSHPPPNRSPFRYKNCSLFLVEYNVLGKPEVSDRLRRLQRRLSDLLALCAHGRGTDLTSELTNRIRLG